MQLGWTHAPTVTIAAKHAKAYRLADNRSGEFSTWDLDVLPGEHGDPMKVYISGPMRGVPDENADVFATAASRLVYQGHEVLTPLVVYDRLTTSRGVTMPDLPELLLGDLSVICKWAEVIVTLLDGPSDRPSLGMAAEVATARALGLFVLTLDEAMRLR